jgi:hypothetical protein
MDPQVLVLFEGVSDERVVVATATARFAAAAAKSDMLGDDDNSAGAKRLRESTSVENGRLSTVRTRLAESREILANYGTAMSVIPDLSLFASASNAEKVDEVDLEEKQSSKMLKRKLPAPTHGWLDASGKVHQRKI